MRVYLDCCSLQRPFDDRRQPRIAVEAEAVLTVLALCKSQHVKLVSSEVLLFEVGRIPHRGRKAGVLAYLGMSSEVIKLTTEGETVARRLEAVGLKPLDALHLASASIARTNYFCTCDDQLLRKAKVLDGLSTTAVSPQELVMELDKWILKCEH